MPDTVSQVGTFRNFYAGREYDDFTGLYYNRARWYDPQAARFISQDPISFAGGDTNLYRYAGNSPDNATDPSGQIIFVVAPILIFGGGLLVGAAHGYADTIAANRDAGALEIGVGVGLGGLFGALNPVGEFFSAGGAIAGGLIEKSQGGDFLGTGFQAGGLGGGLLGGFGTAARHAVRNAGVFGTRQLAGIGLRNGAMAVAPELAGATVGAGYGYYETGTLAGTLHRAQQGLFVGGSASGIYSLGRAGVRKFNQHFEVTVDRSHFYLGMNAGPLNWRLNRKGTKLADSPTAFGTPYKQLSAQRIQLLEAKEADRTITKSDWKHLQWQRRLTDRRQAGVDAFWAQERQLLTQGLPGTRNWNEAARNTIISGQQPRGIFSHHKYSVSQYPQLANDPSNVFPVTMFEHFQKWHGGNWQNATHGVPIRPNLPDSF